MISNTSSLRSWLIIGFTELANTVQYLRCWALGAGGCLGLYPFVSPVLDITPCGFVSNDLQNLSETARSNVYNWCCGVGVGGVVGGIGFGTLGSYTRKKQLPICYYNYIKHLIKLL
jgi:hypothetical protein